jgi:hypothetical protein
MRDVGACAHELLQKTVYIILYHNIIYMSMVIKFSRIGHRTSRHKLLDKVPRPRIRAPHGVIY